MLPLKHLSNRLFSTTVFTLALAAAALTPSCIEGGLNQNQNNSGNQNDGVELLFGEIAIDPTGTFFLASNVESLIYGEIDQSIARKIDSIASPVRLAFGRDKRIFVTSLESNGSRLFCYDLAADAIVWQKAVTTEIGVLPEQDKPLLEVTSDQKAVVLVYTHRISVLDAETGASLLNTSFVDEIVDVDLLRDGKTAVVTLRESWGQGNPMVSVVLLDLSIGTKIEITVPNCASELILSAQQDKAFLAPTNCQKDPVSVIDLKTQTFVRNLPGFGPVAMSPSGKEMIAFMNMDNLDESLFEEGEQIPVRESQYRLMFIDVATLAFETIDMGDQLPRYALTPDGQILLVDNFMWFEDSKIRIVNIAERKLYPVSGPEVTLEDFVMTTDSERVLLLYDGLFELSIPERIIRPIPLSFIPLNLNITPDDKYLLLRQSHTLLWVYDIESHGIDHSICVPSSL